MVRVLGKISLRTTSLGSADVATLERRMSQPSALVGTSMRKYRHVLAVWLVMVLLPPSKFTVMTERARMVRV